MSKKKFLILVLFIFVVIFTSGSFLAMKSGLLYEKDLLENPPAKRCSECHKAIFEQWKKSRHAVAWTSEGFKKETEQYKKQKCMGCHNPLQMAFDEKPSGREFHLEDGISCLSCHFRKGKMFGPYDVISPKHPAQQNDGYKQSGFCQGCHVKTYKEWQKTKVFKTCQECHMKSKRAKMIDKFPFDLLPIHSTVDVGDHSSPGLIVTKKELQFGLELENGSVKVFLENVGVPHNLPTAQNGDPRLYLKLFFMDGSGGLLEKEKIIFAPQLDTALNYKKRWSDSFHLPEGFDKVKATISIRKAWKKEKEVLFEFEKQI